MEDLVPLQGDSFLEAGLNLRHASQHASAEICGLMGPNLTASPK